MNKLINIPENLFSELSPDGLLDKLAGHVGGHLGVHQGHGAGQCFLVLVPHPQHTDTLATQAVGVILFLELGSHGHATHLLGYLLH